MSTLIIDVDKYNLGCYFFLMLKPEQSRAARAWLNWSQEDLAGKAKVSLSTVRDFEKGKREPIANNLDALERALASAGVQFTFNGNEPLGVEVHS
jgi:transcriptional regulator with XRE-family HTH domain